MTFTTSTLADHLDRQVTVRSGYLTFRLYADGWLVRFTPFAGRPEKIDGADAETACRFATEHA